MRTVSSLILCQARACNRHGNETFTRHFVRRLLPKERDARTSWSSRDVKEYATITYDAPRNLRALAKTVKLRRYIYNETRNTEIYDRSTGCRNVLRNDLSAWGSRAVIPARVPAVSRPTPRIMRDSRRGDASSSRKERWGSSRKGGGEQRLSFNNAVGVVGCLPARARCGQQCGPCCYTIASALCAQRGGKRRGALRLHYRPVASSSHKENSQLAFNATATRRSARAHASRCTSSVCIYTSRIHVLLAILLALCADLAMG